MPSPPWNTDNAAQFLARLEAWFAEHQRSDLPWRQTRDPYRIWISEVMLQQTQVDRVVGYFNRFMERFPTVQDLAAAEWEEVLERWRGLGFYGRGRRLLEAAQVIVNEGQGRFPETARELTALPGIGPYTAGAILSFAHNRPEPALDTNGYRVLGRLFASAPHKQAKPTPGQWEALARQLIPEGGSRWFHSALMDFGSLVCASRAPLCEACPMNGICLARQRGDDDLAASGLKRSRPQPPVPDKPLVEVAVAIIRDTEGRILLSRRREGQRLAGAWEFPGGKREAGETWRACLKREIMEELGIEIAVRPVWQTLDHDYGDQVVRLRFYRCSLLRGEAAGREGQAIEWVPPGELASREFPEANGPIIEQLAK